jgi:hypothetical protein
MNRSVGARLALACSLIVQAGCSALVGARSRRGLLRKAAWLNGGGSTIAEVT